MFAGEKKILNKVLPHGVEDIQQNACFQTYGAVLCIGLEAECIALRNFKFFAIHGKAETAGLHIGQLLMGMRMHRTNAALFKMDFHNHHLIAVSKHSAAYASALIGKRNLMAVYNLFILYFTSMICLLPFSY